MATRASLDRPLKVVTVRRGRHEDRDAAKDRHFAAHPEDQDADIVIFQNFTMMREWPARATIVPPAEPPREEP